MIRSELVQKLCGDFPDLTQREVEGVVGACSIPSPTSWPAAAASSCAASAPSRRVSAMRASAAIRAPATRSTVDAKRVPYFKPGKEMRERLNLSDGYCRVAGRELPLRCGWIGGRGGTVDAGDLKSSSRLGVWVQFPPSAPASPADMPGISRTKLSSLRRAPGRFALAITQTQIINLVSVVHALCSCVGSPCDLARRWKVRGTTGSCSEPSLRPSSCLSATAHPSSARSAAPKS